MLALALAGRTPGSVTSSSCVAVFRFTLSAAASGAARASTETSAAMPASRRNVDLMRVSPLVACSRRGCLAHLESTGRAERVMPVWQRFFTVALDRRWNGGGRWLGGGGGSRG